MQNPWDMDWNAGAPAPAATPSAPVTIQGPPRLPAPQTPAQAEKDRLDAERTRQQLAQGPADAAKAAAEAQKAEAEATKLRAEMAGRVSALEALSQQIDRVQELYRRNFANQGLKTPLEYLPTPVSQQFNAAAAGLGEQAFAAFRVPGAGPQSDADLRAFVAANQPSNTDSDLQIQEKVDNIRRRLNLARSALPGAQAPGSTPVDAAHPLDPEGIGDIGFASPASAEANSLPEGAQQFQRDLTYQIAQGRLKTAEEIIAYGLSRGFNVDPKSARDAAESINRGGGFSVATPEFPKADISEDRGQGGAGEAVTAGARGIPAVLGLDDELGALSGYLGDSIIPGANAAPGGQEPPKTFAERLAYERSIRDYDEENHFLPRLAGQFLGGAALAPFSTVPNAGRAAGTAALRSGLGMDAARLAAARAGTTRMAQEGAALGGFYGFGATDGNVGDRLVGAGVNAAVGGALGGLVGRAGQRLVRPSAPPLPGAAPTGRQVLDAARRQEIPIIPADVGGSVTRGITGGARQMIMSELPIGGRLTESAGRAAERRGAAAAMEGSNLPTDEAGEAIRRGAQEFSRRTSGVGGRLYERAERLAGNTTVNPTRVRAILDGEIARAESAPGGLPLASQLRTIRDDLNRIGGNLSVRAVRDMRTNLRSSIDSAGLRNSDTDRILTRIVDAGRDDISSALNAAGRGNATRAFARADQFWRQRVETIDQTLEPVIGKRASRSGEQIIQSLEGMANDRGGNSARLRQLMHSLPSNEAADVRATVIGRLGIPTAGAAQGEGGFAFNTFLTRWNAISPKAKDVLFRGEARRVLDDLATIARSSRGTGTYANHSGTGRAVSLQAVLATLVGTGSGAVGGVGAAAGSVAALGGVQYGLGRILASPTAARALVRIAEAPSRAAANTQIRRLTAIAASNPSIANDVTGLQRALLRVVNDNAPRAASAVASPNEGPDEQ